MSSPDVIVDLNITSELGADGWVVSVAPTVDGVACVDFADASLTKELGSSGWTVTYTEDACQDE